MHLRHVLFGATIGVALLLSSTAVSAQATTTAERLIRQEQVREAVEDAFDLYVVQTNKGGVKNDHLVRAVDRLVEIGPEAVPYLVSELEQALRTTFFFVAYALGRIGTEEAEQALREAIVSADKEPGDWGELRKAWCCWALGLMGIPEALDLVYEGRHQPGHSPIHGDFTVTESIAVQTAPESVALLEKHWDNFNSENDERYSERVILVKALGHIHGPRTREVLIRILEEEHPLLARQAAYSLGEHDSPEAVTALLEALDTPDIRVRRAVAIALYNALPEGRLEAPVAKLKSEENPIVRGALYKVIGRAGGPQYTDVLIAQWGREDPIDRRQLVQVLPQLDHEKVLPVLKQALRDPDNQVSVAAVIALAKLGTPGAIQVLIDSVSSPFWTLASTCVDELALIHETRATLPIATRLIEVELAGVVKDPRRRMRVEKLGDALVALGGTDHLDALREAASRQKDGHLVEYLSRQIKRLETQRDNGNKSKRWLEALASSDPDVRLLAYDFFARNGNARSARTLVDMFGRVEPAEGQAILRAVGKVDSEATRELIGRVLTAPEFDTFERASLRDQAAWSARQIGGAAMRDLLENAVERRDGRDTRPLVYFALLAGSDSLPILARYRTLRMRYITWARGKEMKKLDWIQRELQHGRPLDPVDVPPQDLAF